MYDHNTSEKLCYTRLPTLLSKMAATPTTVVNVKTKYIRPEYNTLQEWMADTARNVYVARRGVVFVPAPPQDGGAFLTRKPNAKVRFPKEDSPFANPFKIPKDVKVITDPTSQAYAAQVSIVLVKYEAHIRAKIEKGEITEEMIKSLKGKKLGCWCKRPDLKNGDGVPCHADIILKLLKERGLE